MSTKEKSDLALFCERVFPEQSLSKNLRRKRQNIAGKILKHKGGEAAAEYLTENWEDEAPNLGPPAKAHIVAVSRPFEQWPIVKVSKAIQEAIYNQTLEQFEATFPELNDKSRKAWLEATGIEAQGLKAQGLNLILQHAGARYRGVITRTNNANKEKAKKFEVHNKKRVARGEEPKEFTPKPTFGEDGRFVEMPGINPNLYCFQAISPRPFDPDKPGGVKLPESCTFYDRKPDAPITTGVVNRLSIPVGQPGHIPEHQRTGDGTAGTVNPHKKRILKYPKAKNGGHGPPTNDSILAVIHIDEDWVLLDLRGLLRNVYFRNVAPVGSFTPSTLLKMFSGDPVLNTKTGEVTFCYQDESDGMVVARMTTYKGKKTKELIEKLTENGETIGLLSIDLGQTNPVAASSNRVRRVDGVIKLPQSLEVVETFGLPDEILNDIRNYRNQYDLFMDGVRKAAFDSLTPEQQKEISEHEARSAQESKANVCHKFDIGLDDIQWDKMTSRSTRIVDHLAKLNRDLDGLTFQAKVKTGKNKGKVTTRRVWDTRISRMSDIRPHLSDETRELLNKTTWDLMLKHPKFHKLAVWKQQFCRKARNYSIKRAEKRLQCKTLVISLEDLPVAGKIHSGGGKYETKGWDSFFKPKQENRHMTKPMHKAFTEAGFKGYHVCEPCAHRTSMTCDQPECRHVDGDSRDPFNRERFECTKCHTVRHADFEIATYNIAWVAIDGKALPKEEKKAKATKKKTPVKENSQSCTASGV